VTKARLTVVTPLEGRHDEAKPVPTVDGPARGGRGLLLTAAVAISFFWISFDHGSFDIGGRTLITVAVWWLLAGAVALDLWPVGRVPVEALVSAAGLAGLAILTSASIAWGATAEDALTELNRVLLYLGVFLVAALGISKGNVGRLCDGAALGVGIIAALALFTRLYPSVIDTSEALRFLPYGRARLNYPVGYWNGLAILLALTIPLLLRLATVGRLAVRAVAVSTLPVFGGVMYLTGSRTGVIAAVTAALAFIALTPRRLAASAAILLAGSATVGVVALFASRDALVDGPLGSAAAEAQGHSAAPLILVMCVAAGIVYALGVVGARRLPRPNPLAEKIPLVVAAVLIIAAVAAADPLERFDDFKRLPTELQAEGAAVQGRIGDTSGNGRWQMWTAAAEQFRAHPIVGDGAGSFQSWWERHRPLVLFVRDAHSLYMETLGELGVVGLGFLLAALGAGAVAIGRRVGQAEEGPRVALAGTAATLAAFVIAAAADWMWEFTVVGVAGVAALGLVTGPAIAITDEPRPASRPRLRRALLALAATLTVIVLALIPLLGEIKVRDSQAATRQGQLDVALEDALAARSLEPWAATPYLQVALVHESADRLPQARSWIVDAIDRDRSNWLLWLVKARIETKAGDVRAARRSLTRARELNPLSFLGPGNGS
jgi:O-Antigen ligase